MDFRIYRNTKYTKRWNLMNLLHWYLRGFTRISCWILPVKWKRFPNWGFDHFLGQGKEWKAYVALLISKEFAAQYQEYPYKSSTQEWHGCAIRFRNPEQLSKIIKYKPNVIQKEETGKN